MRIWNVPGPPLDPEGGELSQNLLVLLLVPVMVLVPFSSGSNANASSSTHLS